MTDGVDLRIKMWGKDPCSALLICREIRNTLLTLKMMWTDVNETQLTKYCPYIPYLSTYLY